MGTVFVMDALIAVLWGIVTLVGWRRPSRMALVPGWIASITAGVAFAIGMSSADAAGTLRGMTSETGNPGLAAVAAWVYEALRPAIATSYFAAAMMIVTLVLLQRVRGEGGGGGRERVLTCVTIAGLAASFVLHHRAVTAIRDIFTLTVPADRTLQETSDAVMASVQWSMGVAFVTGLVSIVIVAMTLKPREERPSSAEAARTLHILAALACLVTIGGALWIRAAAQFFLQLAMTGRLP